MFSRVPQVKNFAFIILAIVFSILVSLLLFSTIDNPKHWSITQSVKSPNKHVVKSAGNHSVKPIQPLTPVTVDTSFHTIGTSFHNEWFRKYFQLFDYVGHTHHKSLPSYYPKKSKQLFTKYIILTDEEQYKCKFNIEHEIIPNNPTFKWFKIGETSSKYFIDWNSFYCETLLTLHGYLMWKINFFIIENSSITVNKSIREFEIRINAFNPTNETAKHDILRSGGKVRDPIYDSVNKIWKYPSHFYILEPNLWHNIYPIHTYDNRYYEFKYPEAPDLGRAYPQKLFENGSSYDIINKYYKNYFGNKLSDDFTIADYIYDFNEMHYYGSTLQNTPFQISIDFYDYNFDANMPKLYCYNPLFHFDTYQNNVQQINVKINNDTIDIKDKIIYVLPQRIGRWYYNENNIFDKDEGAWLEPDCEWKRFDFEEIERKIFVGSNMHMKLIGASNYQMVINAYHGELCPSERKVFDNGDLCVNANNTKYNELSIEWQYFRGSCLYWRNHGTKCADPFTQNIVNKQQDCRYMLGLTGQTQKHRKANITFISNGLWTHRYSNLSHTLKLYEGFEYMMNDCDENFHDDMITTVMFYKQVFATHAVIKHRMELYRFINYQLENYIQLALKTINENKGYIHGVIWDFERTFTRHLTHDCMHQSGEFYVRHNHDIFNEILRYIPSDMYDECMNGFDHTCLMSMLH